MRTGKRNRRAGVTPTWGRPRGACPLHHRPKRVADLRNCAENREENGTARLPRLPGRRRLAAHRQSLIRDPSPAVVLGTPSPAQFLADPLLEEDFETIQLLVVAGGVAVTEMQLADAGGDG